MLSSEKTFKRKNCLEDVQVEIQKLLEQEFIVEIKQVNYNVPEWYLPMQAVLTLDRTTKLRLVFDASAKGQNGKSLKHHLEKGPIYINSLPNGLMAWCFDQVAYTGDMRKMFNQVRIHPGDHVFHRFLRRTNESEQPRVYQWVRLNFGDKPAPDIAAAAIKTLTKASGAQYLEGAKEFYSMSTWTILAVPERMNQDAGKLQVKSMPFSQQDNFKSKHGTPTTRTLTSQMRNVQSFSAISGTKLSTRFPSRRAKSSHSCWIPWVS